MILRMAKKTIKKELVKLPKESNYIDNTNKDQKESKIANVHLRIEESEKDEWEAHLKEQKYPSLSQFIRVAVKELMEKEKTMTNNMIVHLQKEMLDFAKETVQVLKEELLREANLIRMK